MNLGTTNLFLGILAIVSVIELLGFIGAAIVAYRLYGRAVALVQGLEERQVAPAMARVNAILDDVKDVTADVKDVTATVHEETDRVDQAIRGTIGRVDETADRVRVNVKARANRVLGFLHGLRVAVGTFVGTEPNRRVGA